MSYYIIEELILEILTRLPPKSLLRFRSVCKSWYSCISGPDFIRMHTFQSPQKILIKHRTLGREGFYTLHSEDQLPLCPAHGYTGIMPLNFPCYKHSYKEIIGLCNGIMCLTDPFEHIWLWNPSIRRKLFVPDCPRVYSDWEATGFGFDRITDDHKIVIIPKIIHGKGRIVESSFVYSMKTGAWCVISSPTPPPFSSVMTRKACFVNGALHWVVVNKPCLCIMTFDLNNHVFGTIELPELGPDRDTTGLTTFQGCLAMLSISTQKLDNWIWMRRGVSWSVIFKSETKNDLEEAILRALKLSSRGDLLVLTCERTLRLYNPDGGTLVLQNNAAAFLYDPERGAHSTQVRTDRNAASLVDDIRLCAETLHLLDMGTTCYGGTHYHFFK